MTSTVRRRPIRAATATMGTLALVAATVAAAPAASADFGRPAQPVEPTDIIEDSVLDSLETKDATDIWVRFEAEADTGPAATTTDWVDRGQQVVDTLKSTAAASQGEATKVLDEAGVTYDTFWITNAIQVDDASHSLTERLASLDGVEQIRAPRTYEMPDPIEGKGPGDISPDALEWGVENINADDVWSDFGTGEGIVVANIDSGVDYDHEALASQYRGNNGDGTFDHNYNWFDATGTSDEPFDGAGSSHGTHTMGTMVGDDGGDNQIGVAPGATWIAANGCNTCSDADLIASGEWMLEPTDLNGENGDVSKRPHIVNNSWGTILPSNDPFMEDILENWSNAGIFGVWSNGNSGPACETSGSPGSRILNYSIGAYDVNNEIAGFSSRGPGQDGEIKPNASAPGVNVRSATDGDNYGSLSGTSMAAPHAAGAIALLWSAAPSLVSDIEGTRELLNSTAIDVDDTSCGGTAEDNNVWGEGRIDALALVEGAPTGETGTLAGTVADAEGDPVADATVTASNDDTTRDVETGEDGTYSLTLTEGTYDVTVEAFGYATYSDSAEIVAEETTTLDVPLEAAESHSVTGTVTDASSGDPVAGAVVSVDGTPIESVETGTDGSYTFESVPAGTYTVTASSGDRCATPASTEVIVDGDVTADLELPKVTDEFGYFCDTGNADYVEGDTLVDLSGDEATTSLELPFDFPFYGESYGTAYLSSNGHVNFLEAVTGFSNDSIPTSSDPNAAIYPFWDDMRIEDDGAVYTSTLDDAFVIEYRNVSFFGASDQNVDFSLTLHADGQIDVAYRNIDADADRENGSSATLGIENADGTDALEYSFNEPVVSDEFSITYDLPPNGTVEGTVTDANDGLPVDGATVTVTDDAGDVVREVSTDEDGAYSTLLFFGDYTVEATSSGYVADSDTVVIDEDGETNTLDFALATGIADVEYDTMSWTLTEGETRSTEVTITNSGTADLTWEIGESMQSQGRQKMPEPAARTNDEMKVDSLATTAEGLYSDEQKKAQQDRAPSLSFGTNASPDDAGDVLESWTAEGPDTAWGVGFNSDVWISDATGLNNHQFATDGTPLNEFPANWGGTWPGDMAQDTSSGAMCQVNVGGDNGIHCFDPATGEAEYSITGSPWSNISQRGLAYNPVDDVFYTGGWNEGIIYTVAGMSHGTPGETLAQFQPEDSGIAGISYNPTSDTIWYVNSAATTTLYQISPEDGSTISTLPYPSSDTFPGAGLEMGATGNLWATNQNTGEVMLIESGDPHISDLPWLSADPSEGTLAPGESTTVTVTVDSTGLEPDVYEASLLVDTNAGRVPTVTMPVELIVSNYMVGANSGGDEYTDSSEFTWSADQEYTEENGWGWVGQRVETESTTESIGGTEDEALYQSRRTGMFDYQYDDVPAGTYAVDLGFAEYQANKLPHRRIFDVSINDDFVLVGHDVAAEVRGQWADDHTLVVEHDGGPLSIEFHDRAMYELPIVNSVKVTERPDL